jgi:hypothetical protein
MSFIETTTSEYYDAERSKVYFSKYPAGGPVRCWTHMGQQLKANRFIEFDYGPEKNKAKYN